MENLAEELLGTTAEPVETVEEPVKTDTTEASEAHESQEEVIEPEKVEVEDEPTSPAPVETVPLSAHIGLRKDLEGQIESLRAQITTPEEPKKDFFEDPEGSLNALRSEFSETMTNQLLNEGQAEAIRQHDQETVDKAVEWVAAAVASSPYIAQQFTQTPLLQQHRKAVELFQQEQARADLADPATLKASMKDEVRKELIAEMEAEKTGKAELSASIPKSLTGDSSKGGLTGSDWSGPVELDTLIGTGG
jgi:hypothetical protein